MNISSFQKISLQDYPGKVSTICFVSGCQLRCPYCHNPNLVLPEMYIESMENMAHDFISYIIKRKTLIEGVVLSGGEPLLQNDVIDFICQIKELGLSIKLDTNGMLPDRLKSLIDAKLLDYIALDYKGPANNLNKSVGLELHNTDKILYNNWAKSLKLIHNSSLDYELRTTVVKQIHSKNCLSVMGKELNMLVPSLVPRWFLQTFENKTNILNEYTDNKISLSAYSKEEMIQIKDSLGNIVPGVSLRNTL